MDDNAMLMLNAVAIIERFAPRYSQWLERQENMLKRIEQLNNDLLQEVKLGVDCSSVLSPFIDTSDFHSSRIIRNPKRKHSVKKEGHHGTCLLPKNEGVNKNEGSSRQTTSANQKVKPEPPATSTKSNSQNLDATKQEQRDLVQPCSGHTQTQCPHSIRGQSKNTQRASEESTAATGDNPPQLLRVPPFDNSMSTRGHNARGSRRPGRGHRGRGRGRGRGSRDNHGRGSFTNIPSIPVHRLDSSDSDGSEFGMFGFTKDEESELLCQGIMPWDPYAWAALEVLYPGYDEY